LTGTNPGKVAMPDRSISVRERKTGFNQLAVNFIEEAEFDSIRRIAPDSEVASTISKGGAENSGVCWKHWFILPSRRLKNIS
jgi:hypothetical protein